MDVTEAWKGEQTTVRPLSAHQAQRLASPDFLLLVPSPEAGNPSPGHSGGGTVQKAEGDPHHLRWHQEWHPGPSDGKSGLFVSSEFIGVALGDEVIQVSGVRLYHTSTVHCIVCSPPQITSPSITTLPTPPPPPPPPPFPRVPTPRLSVSRWALSMPRAPVGQGAGSAGPLPCPGGQGLWTSPDGCSPGAPS